MNRARRSLRPRLPVRADAPATVELGLVVLCLPDGVGEVFPNDIRTRCVWCRRRVHHRPHVPKHAKPICPDCALILEEGGKP